MKFRGISWGIFIAIFREKWRGAPWCKPYCFICFEATQNVDLSTFLVSQKVVILVVFCHTWVSPHRTRPLGGCMNSRETSSFSCYC